MNTTHFASLCARALRCALVSLLIICAMGGATAQEASNTAAATTEDATGNTARVRLFGQNGTTVDFYQNSRCIGGRAARTRVSGGAGDAFASFLGYVKNTSIGMTESPTTSSLARRDGIVSKAYFREYEIPANEPMTLSMYFQSAVGAPGSVSCSDLGGTFTPEAEKEYEVTLDFLPGRCIAVVREIQKNEQGSATLRDVAIVPTQKCT